MKPQVILNLEDGLLKLIQMKDLELEAFVIEEATNLKKYATKEELAKLNYNHLEGDNRFKCIYGQMTGTCDSNRASNLIFLCVSRVYKSGKFYSFKGELNGASTRAKEFRSCSYHTPIEKFLYKYKPERNSKSTKVEKLVSFLKGEIQELKF